MTDQRPDTSDMLAVHAVFRDAFDQAPALVAGASGDPRRTALVAGYYANVLGFLDVHHDGEDELLWPPLRARAGDEALLRRMDAQHHDVVPWRHAAGDALATWTAAPGPATSEELTRTLLALQGRLTPHLDEEECLIVPPAARYLTRAEWGALPEHGMRAFGGDKVWLVIGLIRDRMTQQQRDGMLQHMPPPAAAFWAETGEGLYRSYRAELGV